jgi:hypothetical protein
LAEKFIQFIRGIYLTTKEKRLLFIAALMFFGYMLPFYMWPIASSYYQNYRDNIERLQTQIERYEKLAADATFWEEENQKAKLERDKTLAGLLQGDNRELVGAKMQGLIKQLAQNTGITFKTLDPPDTSLSTGEWVLVIQSMQFEADSRTLIEFLKALQRTPETLKVASLDVRSSRTQLTCTIKVTGFSRFPAPTETERQGG